MLEGLGVLGGELGDRLLRLRRRQHTRRDDWGPRLQHQNAKTHTLAMLSQNMRDLPPLGPSTLDGVKDDGSRGRYSKPCCSSSNSSITCTNHTQNALRLAVDVVYKLVVTHLGSQQPGEVRSARKLEARDKLFGDGGTTNHMTALQHQHILALQRSVPRTARKHPAGAHTVVCGSTYRLREVSRGDKAIMAATDDDGVTPTLSACDVRASRREVPASAVRYKLEHTTRATAQRTCASRAPSAWTGRPASHGLPARQLP